MSLTTILSEIWRFIKNNLLKILIGSIIISALVVLSRQFLPSLMDQPMEEQQANPEEQTEVVELTEKMQESREFLAQVYEQEPATFSMFVQLEDGNTFTNSFIFDEFFTTPEVVEEVENQTGINYSQTLRHEINLRLYKTSRYRGSVAGIRDTSSNVITVRVQAGENAEENLTLATTFYEMILNNEIPFLDGLQVTIMSDPDIGETLTENNLEMVSSPAALGTFSPAESEGQSIFLYALAGFFIGLILSTIVLFVIQLFKNTINYAFQYSWDFNDHHFIYEQETDDNKLKEILLYQEKNNSILVANESPFVEQLVTNMPELENKTSLMGETLNKNQSEDIVILVESNVTDRPWYNEQYRLAELHDNEITIIHVIN